MYQEVLTSFVTLFVIMDPFVSLPVLLGLTAHTSKEKRARVANYATIIAAVVLFVFLIFSEKLLELLQITMSSFMIGGGLILLIMGIENVLGISFEKSKKAQDVNAAAVIIGTPLLTGPGVIAKVTALAVIYDKFTVGIAAVITLVVTWVILRQAEWFYKVLGERVIAIISRVMGLFLTAIAIEMIATGVKKIVLGI